MYPGPYFICPPGRARTFDRQLKRLLLYQLSYRGILVYIYHFIPVSLKGVRKVSRTFLTSTSFTTGGYWWV